MKNNNLKAFYKSHYFLIVQTQDNSDIIQIDKLKSKNKRTAKAKTNNIIDTTIEGGDNYCWL